MSHWALHFESLVSSFEEFLRETVRIIVFNAEGHLVTVVIHDLSPIHARILWVVLRL